jgi:hypothetical protein
VLIIRLAGLFFAFVQLTLVLRLALPFVEVPPGLAPYVPTLLTVTDLWLLPVEVIAARFELTGVAEDLAAAGDGNVTGPESFEPMIVVAMIFWGVVASFAIFVLRLIFRPAG